ncbi:MAG TPA: trypsin-like peptidase domain-containing protein [Ktedonobacterales bacterium]|nr:trypsin-like peptidase domain-containing protein [Ktedonobacterales bacterium]
MHTSPVSSTPSFHGDNLSAREIQGPLMPPAEAAIVTQQTPEILPPQAPGDGQSFEWQSYFANIPPMPPFVDGTPPAGRPRRRRWSAALVALALFVVLGAGAATGAAIANGRGASARTVVIGATSAPAITLSSSVNSLQQSVVSVTKAVQPSVVEITSVAGSQEAIGSGVIVTSDGYIVTNDHVVKGYTSFTVTLSNGTSYVARVVGQDAQDDLAVLKIAATNLQPIAFADSSKAVAGEFAVAVGTPLGLRETTTFGIVSALNRTASEAPSGPAGELTGLIQTSAQINPGNSGGALVNLQGQLLGIPTLEATNPETGAAADGIGYAIPANRVEYVVSQLIQYGKLTATKQGYLGIQGEDVTPQIAAAGNLSVSSGVLVTGFGQDTAGQSPAQQAGLKVGDVITAVDGQAVASNDDLAGAILSRSPNTPATVTVVRGTSQLTLTITLGERPANG